MTEFQEVGDTYCCRLVEHLTGLTVIQVSRAETWQTGLVGPLLEVFQLSTIEDWCRELHTQSFTGRS